MLDPTSTPVATGIVLFDDGSHGDAAGGDGVWSNDGSDAAFPTYTFAGTDPPSAAWQVQVYAADASTSAIGGTDGLLHISGQPNAPENQSNFCNVDGQVFTLAQVDLVMLKTVLTQSDPFNGTTNPKAIPGAVVQYTVVATNQGQGTSDVDTIFVTDPVPANTELVVSDIGGAGSGPVLFTQGAQSSTLSYGFTALGNGADDLEFSSDGGTTWTYSPTPGPNGTDPAVTNIRVNPKGSFAGDSGAGSTSFQLTFLVRVVY